MESTESPRRNRHCCLSRHLGIQIRLELIHEGIPHPHVCSLLASSCARILPGRPHGHALWGMGPPHRGLGPRPRVEERRALHQAHCLGVRAAGLRRVRMQLPLLRGRQRHSAQARRLPSGVHTGWWSLLRSSSARMSCSKAADCSF